MQIYLFLAIIILKMKIALFARDFEAAWCSQLCLIIRTLVDKGVLLCYYKPFYDKIKSLHDFNFPDSQTYTDYTDIPRDTDVFLCFGGDGTFLESLTHIREKSIPIAGVNFGRLGFLTSADLNSGLEWIDDLLTGNYKIEKRTLLKIEADALPPDFFSYSANEVSIQRKDPTMISVTLSIDGVELPTYWSDGLVVATPTGSTAYSLSIGGPIVVPVSKVWIVAPIAPHNLNVRPMVVPDDAVLEMNVSARSGEALLCLDNREVVIKSGESIRITKAEFNLNYISLQKSSFINALKDKLRWGEDKRNSQAL